MNTELTEKDIMVTKWFFNDQVGHQGQIGTPESVLIYMKTLMDIAAADGVLEQRERDWVLGFAAISGATESVLHEIKQYQPRSDEENTLLKHLNVPRGEMSRRSLIYFSFQAAAADGELHCAELTAIQSVATAMGLTDVEFQEIRSLYEKNKELRRDRAMVLHPEGFDNYLTEMKKYYQ